MSKREIYKEYGINYVGGKIESPVGLIPELLVNGNAKLGKGVWTFSMLAGTKEYNVKINGIDYTVKGTCACDCCGCYAQTGNYRFSSTINALAIRTVIAREYIDFMKRAIMAQIQADNIKLLRIHASGDFFSAEYVNAWKEIASNSNSCVFWSYTKVKSFERSFDNIPNVNIVKSLIDGCGFNFGHCDYIIETYQKLLGLEKTVHICKCGVDKNQHCVNCKGCSENEYVLFIEHSTAYKAETDSSFPALVKLINAQ